MLTSFFFFFNDTATTEIYTLSLHDALPIWSAASAARPGTTRVAHRWRQSGTASSASSPPSARAGAGVPRSEEHTSELQSQSNLVCRLLLEKKKRNSRKVCMQTLPRYASGYT